MDQSASRSPSKPTLEATASADFLRALAAAMIRLVPRRGDKLLLGVSGGADSMALLHGLVALNYRRLVICHLDHHLRGGASAADAVFVARVAQDLGLVVKCGGRDVRELAGAQALSVEMAARQARHEFFAACAREERCGRVLLAHHEDDQIETVVHHFFRGSGRRGLGGMAERSVIRAGGRRLEFLRPMLGIARDAARAWLGEKNIAWREDASNLSPQHTRNRLRHRLLPVLDEILGRNFRGPILHLAAILREEDEFLESLPVSFPLAGSTLPARKLAAQPQPMRRRIVLRWLKAAGLREPRFRDVEEVLRLLEPCGKPAKVNLPEGGHARRRNGRIFLEFPLQSEKPRS